MSIEILSFKCLHKDLTNLDEPIIEARPQCPNCNAHIQLYVAVHYVNGQMAICKHRSDVGPNPIPEGWWETEEV